MDGGTLPELLEVTQDVFSGSLALPIFNRPQSCEPYDCPERNGLPAGQRIEWRRHGDPYGKPCAVKLTTASGTSYWLAPDMPLRTYAEAMEELERNLKKGAGTALAEINEIEARAAAKHGMTVEKYRIYVKDADTLRARRNAARQYQERTEDYLRRMHATGKLKD
jgi:hypothetical protein